MDVIVCAFVGHAFFQRGSVQQKTFIVFGTIIKNYKTVVLSAFVKYTLRKYFLNVIKIVLSCSLSVKKNYELSDSGFYG